MDDKQDAARYRWLRTHCADRLGDWWAICPPAPHAAVESPEELDRLVDAEIASQSDASGEGDDPQT